MTAYSALPIGNRYNIIYADPAWTFEDKNRNGNRGAACKYEVMTLEQMKLLSVPKLAAENCALFMWWVPSQAARALAEAWGFSVKTMNAFTWVKMNKHWLKDLKKRIRSGELNIDDIDEASALQLLLQSTKMGLGRHTRGNTESCLIALKGKNQRINGGVRQLIFAPLREHSRKPDEAVTRIEQLYGDLPRIELFSRQTRTGWDCWGNQTDKFTTEAA